MAAHSSILAWRITWTEEPGGGCSPWGHKELDMTEVTQQQQDGEGGLRGRRRAYTCG